jgi:hypothetical protein
VCDIEVEVRRRGGPPRMRSITGIEKARDVPKMLAGMEQIDYLI